VWQENLKEPTKIWNGRQIKNAFQTAISLARCGFFKENNVLKLERPLVKRKHFRRVVDIAAYFDDSLE
jgi:hypothetical protein